MEYQEINGTFYKKTTNDDVIRMLEHARNNHIRITLDYGDAKTGRSWGEQYDITGYVGRSTGSIKIPLLIYNNRSMGGGSILDDCIISIKYANKKMGGYLYKFNNEV